MPVPELDARADLPDGTLVERCPALPGCVASVTARLAKGGAALFVDYGHWRSRGDTLQALRDHAPEDPLATPGDADLTAHVDFEAIAEAATPRPGKRHGPARRPPRTPRDHDPARRPSPNGSTAPRARRISPRIAA